MKISAERFNEFDVYSCDDDKCFKHIEITSNRIDFYKNMFAYFFDESRLLRYAENKSSINFRPTIKNYAFLYKWLALFIDKENEIDFPDTEEDDIKNILEQEYHVIDVNGQRKIRFDKIGKIGEYIFSNLLSEYFCLECIIPKLNLTTDRNMNVYGIDTLFYSPQKKTIFIGESKVSKSIEHGIRLINKSLSTYREQADEEFLLILTNRWLKDKMGSFSKDFGEVIEISLSMLDFIKRADISQVAIPIFIAHGGQEKVNDIFLKLKRINKIKLYGLDTLFISISLPIIDKDEMMNIFTNEINRRRLSYETALRT